MNYIYSSRDFKYNINAFTRVDIKDSYTEDDKLAIFDSLPNNVLGHDQKLERGWL